MTAFILATVLHFPIKAPPPKRPPIPPSCVAQPWRCK